MKTRRIPAIGFYIYIVSFIVLIIGYITAIQTFNIFQYKLDRFVILFPLFAMWIIVLEIIVSFVDKNKPAFTAAIDILFTVFVIFAFAKTLIPFLTNIATYFTVAMGDMALFAVGVPRCITSCVLFIVSGVLFTIGSFFKVINIKEVKNND